MTERCPGCHMVVWSGLHVCPALNKADTDTSVFKTYDDQYDKLRDHLTEKLRERLTRPRS